MSSIKTAIIGYGKMGHIRHRCLAENPNYEVVAVCDVEPANLRDAGCPAYDDWRQVLELKPDAVFVCTTNEFIPHIAVEAINRGIHAFCEKPPGRTVADVEAMRRAEAANPGVRLKFGFNHRYHQSVMDARSIVEHQRLGKVLWVRGIYGKAGGSDYDKNWRNVPSRSGGGILIDQGIHMLDLFHLFVGRFEEVKSMVWSSFWKVAVEDNTVAIMRNPQGQTALIHSSATQWKHTFILDIYLEKGYLTLEGILSSTMTYGRESLKIARCQYDQNGYPQPNPRESITYYSDDRSWELEVAEFAQAIRENGPVREGTSQDALAVMELVHKIYDHDERWRAVNGRNGSRP